MGWEAQPGVESQQYPLNRGGGMAYWEGEIFKRSAESSHGSGVVQQVFRFCQSKGMTPGNGMVPEKSFHLING